MTDWLDYGRTLASDAVAAATDVGEAALGYALAAIELLLVLSLLAAIAPSLVLAAAGAPLWVATLLLFLH